MGIIQVFLIFELIKPVLLTTLTSEGKCSVNKSMHHSNIKKFNFV